MKRPIWAAATATALCLSLVTHYDALLAASVRTIPVREARGEEGQIPTLTIWEETGLNINFIPTGEVVKKVWLDDVSRIGIDFDGALCLSEEGNCSDTGASVIHLRRINPINFPQLPKTQTTLLSIVTEGESGGRNLYQFRVTYGKGKPQYVTVNIAPTTNSPLSQQLLQKPSTTQASLVKTKLPSQGESVTSVEEQIRFIQAGLGNAIKKNLIGKQRKNLYLTHRVQQFVSFLRQGNSLEDSARLARIPIHFINTLEQLGSTSLK